MPLLSVGEWQKEKCGMARRSIRGPLGAVLHLDPDEIFPDDPGNGTPALVEWRDQWGTYWCVSETGDIDGDTVPDSILRWLNSDKISNEVESLYAKH